MEEKGIITHERDGIFMIEINRPHCKNAINTPTARLLLSSILQFQTSPSKVAILYGKHDFCTGFDLTQAHSHNYKTDTSVIAQWQPNELGRGPMGPTRHFCKKPIIAAVNGYCVAGGLELALWCDMVVSNQEAIFGVFCRRVGVPLIDGGTVRLTEIVGMNRARDMILTGREVGGKEAYEWGLVNKLAKKDGVLDEAVKLAQLIASNPQTTMLSDRKSLHESVFGNLEQKLYRQFQLGMESLQNGGSKEGVDKFTKKKQIKPKL